MKSIPNSAVDKVARRLEALLDAIRESSPDYVAEMRHRFMLDVHDAVDQLDAIATIPPISGGAPDDFEEIDLEGLCDPNWPTYPHPEVDGYRWEPNFDGPTPDAVLAASAPFNADYDAWLDRVDAALDYWSEADQMACHGCA